MWPHSELELQHSSHHREPNYRAFRVFIQVPCSALSSPLCIVLVLVLACCCLGVHVKTGSSSGLCIRQGRTWKPMWHSYHFIYCKVPGLCFWCSDETRSRYSTVVCRFVQLIPHQREIWRAALDLRSCRLLPLSPPALQWPVLQDESGDFQIVGARVCSTSQQSAQEAVHESSLKSLVDEAFATLLMLYVTNDQESAQFMPSGLEVSNDNAHMPAQAETTSIQKDMAFDHVNEAETGQAICDTGSFTDSSFTKTLRNLHSLELPAQFVKQHSYNFQAKVVLQGTSGRFTAVHLTIDTSPIQDRVYFRGSEWRDFLLGNGFKVGYELIISLVSKSTFIVRHSGAVDVNIQESVDRIEKSKICQYMRRANLPEKKVRPSERLVGVRLRRDSSETHSSGLESPVNNAITDKSSESQLKSDVVYARGTDWKCQRTVDILVGELQCPHFVAMINKSHLRQWKSSSLSVPREFYKRYAEYFAEGANIFQGPNGRIMKLKFSKNSMRFTSGWKAFHTENDIKLGDVMLFSLPEPAQWLIQLVERKLEEVPMGSECDSSDLE